MSLVTLTQFGMALCGIVIIVCFWKSAVTYGPDNPKQANRWARIGLWAIAALIACFLIGLATILLRKP